MPTIQQVCFLLQIAFDFHAVKVNKATNLPVMIRHKMVPHDYWKRNLICTTVRNKDFSDILHCNMATPRQFQTSHLFQTLVMDTKNLRAFKTCIHISSKYTAAKLQSSNFFSGPRETIANTAALT